MTESLARRAFLLAAGTVPAAALPLAARAADQPANAPPADSQQSGRPQAMLVLNDSQVAFLSATADTMIPADHLSPSGSDIGVVDYIDGQLAGAYGAGDKLYRDGPHPQGTPQQGTQSPLVPRDLLLAGIEQANAWCRSAYGKSFDELPAAQRIAALEQIEAGRATFETIPSAAFFALLLDLTMEGMFADPIYRGNREMAGWKMLGFPGLPATYADSVAAYQGKRYVAAPKSIADFL